MGPEDPSSLQPPAQRGNRARTELTKVGKLFMVDLAGSERLKRSLSTGVLPWGVELSVLEVDWAQEQHEARRAHQLCDQTRISVCSGVSVIESSHSACSKAGVACHAAGTRMTLKWAGAALRVCSSHLRQLLGPHVACYTQTIQARHSACTSLACKCDRVSTGPCLITAQHGLGEQVSGQQRPRASTSPSPRWGCASMLEPTPRSPLCHSATRSSHACSRWAGTKCHSAALDACIMHKPCTGTQASGRR